MVRRQVCIFGPISRDGKQAPGAARIVCGMAAQLARLGVDSLEVGFAKASSGDVAAENRLARPIAGPVITGLCHVKDPEAVARGVESARSLRIPVFMAELKMSLDEVLGRLRALMSKATALVEGFDVLRRPVRTASGGGTRDLSDTVGYAIRDEFSRRLERMPMRTRQLVSQLGERSMHPNEALVGRREADIHQDGMTAKDRPPYEILTSEDFRVGSARSLSTRVTVQPSEMLRRAGPVEHGCLHARFAPKVHALEMTHLERTPYRLGAIGRKSQHGRGKR